MQFVVKRDQLLKSLNFVQGVVEKKNTLPILSNVLLQIKDKKLSIVATDLDIIFYDEIADIKIITEGSTTTSAAILYDILRKISSNAELNFVPDLSKIASLVWALDHKSFISSSLLLFCHLLKGHSPLLLRIPYSSNLVVSLISVCPLIW